jgi:hypothetical protein
MTFGRENSARSFLRVTAIKRFVSSTTFLHFQIIVALEGGYNLNSISYAMTMCAKALVGDPLPPIAPKDPKSGAKESIRSVIRQHSKYWSCLKFGMSLPDQLLTSDYPEMLPESVTVNDDETLVTDSGEPGVSSYIPSQVIVTEYCLSSGQSISKFCF